MFNQIEILFVLLILAVFMVIVHRYNLKLLNKLKIYDLNELKTNKKILTSYGIFLSFYFLIFSFFFYYFYPVKIDMVYIILPFSILILAVICFIDDYKSISIITRVCFFFLIVYLSLGLLKFPTLLEYFKYEKLLNITIVFAWVYFINCSNFLDGGDEYFANSLIPCFGFLCYFYYFVSYNDIYLFFNFLIFIFLIIFRSANRNPAKAYLGDSGSIAIGYIYFFNILKFLESGNYEIAFLLSIFIFLDPTITILVRLTKKLNIFNRHQGFFFHVAKKLGYSVRQISFYMFVNNLIISTCAILILEFNQFKYIFLVIGLLSQSVYLITIIKFKLNFFYKNQ